MNKAGDGEFPFYVFDRLSAETGVLHFVSSGKYDLGFKADNERIVVENRLFLAGAAGFDASRLTVGQQTHSVRIQVVKSGDVGCGGLNPVSAFPETDALVTNEPEACLMVLTADCVPVLLYDPGCRVVAAIHAGWRGSVAGIVARTIALMREVYGCRPEQLLAGIAPSIGKCCFEVGEEVVQAFQEKYSDTDDFVFKGNQSGKYHIDLWEVNRRQLLAAGLVAGNIEVAGRCTVCSPEHFYSYRRDGSVAGRIGTGIMLRRFSDGKG